MIKKCNITQKLTTALIWYMKFKQEQIQNNMYVLVLQECRSACIDVVLFSNHRSILDQVKSHIFATYLPKELED